MRRALITGAAAVTAAGAGVGPLRDALKRGSALGGEEEVALPGGRSRRVRVARLSGFDPDRYLEPGTARRLSSESRLVTATFLLAAEDAACDARPAAADRVGTFLGSGFGSLGTTADYLRGVFQDGMAGASPALFSESLASAPLGHAAMALDARGPSMAFMSGDASIIAALDAAWRAIRSGRIDRAICGSFELMPPVLVSLLARLGARSDRQAHFGEGAVALVLEAEKTARASGARILAALAGVGLAGDPEARATDWSHDPRAWAEAHERALRHEPAGGRRFGAVFRHAPPSPKAARAEGRALEKLFAADGRPEIKNVHRVVGAYAAAGGVAAVAAVLAAGEQPGPILVSAGSWGGTTGALLISPRGA